MRIHVTAMRAMTAIAAVAVVLLSGANCRHGRGAGPTGWQQRWHAGDLTEVPGLSLRGNGCHLELLDPDSAVICGAIAWPMSKCAPLNVSRTGADGGWIHERFSMGSDCPPPRFSSGVMGRGSFLVEGASGVFSAICDDAYGCQRSILREQILRCCSQDKSIQDTAVCRVPPHEGVCVEDLDEEEGDNRNAADLPGDAGLEP